MREATTSTISVRLSRSSIKDCGIRPAIGAQDTAVRGGWTNATETKRPRATRGRAESKSEARPRPGIQALRLYVLVQAYATALFALYFLGVTLNSGCCFALTLGSRLFIKFTAANFGQNTGFFAGALETTQSDVEGFVLFNFDGWHPGLTFFITGGNVAPGRWRWRTYVFKGCGCYRLIARNAKPLIEKRWSARLGAYYYARLLLFSPSKSRRCPCWYWDSKPPATRPVSRSTTANAACWPRPCLARSTCTGCTAAWFPSWPRATTSNACCL